MRRLVGWLSLALRDLVRASHAIVAATFHVPDVLVHDLVNGLSVLVTTPDGHQVLAGSSSSPAS